MALPSFRRMVVDALVTADAALHQLVYRPSVVKLFSWLQFWWLCDLAQASMALDNCWKRGYWAAASPAPRGVCQACDRPYGPARGSKYSGQDLPTASRLYLDFK